MGIRGGGKYEILCRAVPMVGIEARRKKGSFVAGAADASRVPHFVSEWG
jgi:hypothetical protein